MFKLRSGVVVDMARKDMGSWKEGRIERRVLPGRSVLLKQGDGENRRVWNHKVMKKFCACKVRGMTVRDQTFAKPPPTPIHKDNVNAATAGTGRQRRRPADHKTQASSANSHVPGVHDAGE